MSLFKVTGVSTFKDGIKVRFANDVTRVKILTKNGHTDIELIELPESMSKADAVKHLLTTELAQNPKFRAAIDEANEKYNAVKTVKVKAVKQVPAPKKDAPKKAAPAKTKAAPKKVNTKQPAAALKKPEVTA